MVKARIENGAWLAKEKESRVWIKILHKKELLGEAKLFDYMYEGLDRSDVPQRQTIRESYWQDYEPPAPSTYRNEDMIEIERLEGTGEYTGEECSQVRSELTPEAAERLSVEDEHYHHREQQKLEDKIESTFVKALESIHERNKI